MNYGYESGNLYFHSAHEGRKIDILRSNSYACFEIENDLELVTGENLHDWSMGFRCVIGYGHIEELRETGEKIKALRILMNHYSGRDDWEFSEEEISSVLVLRLRIEEITGKKS